MAKPHASILADFLAQLGVPHTRWYADSQFASMTFKSLFGFSKVLESYGVPSEALEVPDKAAALDAITPPFLAQCGSSFVIVTAIEPESVTFLDGLADGPVAKSRAEFCRSWSGIVLLAYPGDDSREPDYASHRFTEIGNRAKRRVLAAAALFVLLYLVIAHGICSHVSTLLLTLINLAGLYVTYQLVLKSLNIHTGSADRICGIIDRTGCHTVLSTSASKFFGLFGWSEVGLAYFSVSLGTLLLFPQHIGELALINACCCPFSLWSVWYQKYRAKAWCTLCLITQACLWLSLACYIFGGAFAGSLPPRVSILPLGATYVIVLLGVNALMRYFDRNDKNTPQ
ncbi:MAG: cysteine peptidase family C39 domain-containing protein [Muribaculaceae bacterium]|nr:cysteine peptidase family C39 domain-containing protein [Muribaculaceae bacterium]